MLANSQVPPPDTSPKSSLIRIREAFTNHGLTMHGTHEDFMAQCPVHQDNKASLSVKYIPGKDGRILLNCFGCQANYADIAAALDLTVSDLFDNPLPPPEKLKGRSAASRKTGKRWGRIGPLPSPIVNPSPQNEENLNWTTTAKYDYAKPDGEIIQQVVRQEAIDSQGVSHKRFYQQFLTNTGTTNKKPAGFKPTWYRAPELVDAIFDNLPIWIVEGEKDVHTAENQGVIAATNAGGANTLSEEMLKQLHGSTLNLVLDRDLAGYQRGVHFIESLKEHATLNVFLPATTNPKSDLTDHIQAGGTLNTLIPTNLLELQAWINTIQAEDRLKGIEQCKQEASAHQKEAKTKKATAPKTSQDHEKKAKRWIIEAERRFEPLSENVINAERFASQTDTTWAKEASEYAKNIRQQALSIIQELYKNQNQPLPQHLTSLNPQPQTKPATKTKNLLPAPKLPESANTTITIQAPNYIIENGSICKEEWVPSKNDGEQTRRLKLILNLDPIITHRDQNEDLDDSHFLDNVELLDEENYLEPQTNQVKRIKLTGIRSYTIEFTHPQSKERLSLEVDADDAISGKWLEKLDFSLDYARTKTGLAEVWRAIEKVSQTQISRTLYQSTGWRKLPDGTWGFVHAGGIITAKENQPAPVGLSGPLTRIHLPNPTQNPQTLKQAFDSTIGTLNKQLPSRVVLPMFGHILRAALGHNPMILILVGVPGTYKSSLAECMMNFWGEKWRRNQPTTSLAGTGSTLNASRITMSRAKDTIFWADDVAPDQGIAYAQRTIKQFARMISERTSRDRSNREGTAVNVGDIPNCSGLITSEFAPEAGSGQQRTFPLPLRKGEILLETMKSQSERERRYQRALLMSSFIQWIAKNDAKKIRYQADLESDNYMDRLFNSYLNPRVDERPATAITNMWTGFKLFVEFLTDTGAFTDLEAQKWLKQMNESLFEAWKSTVDPDIPASIGGRVRELLQYALHQGIGYISDCETGHNPFQYATRLGWRKTKIGIEERFDAKGQHLGWINQHGPNGPEIYLNPTAMHHVLSLSRGVLGSAIELDEFTAKRALFDEGILQTDTPQPGKAPKMTKSRHIKAIDARQRVLVIPFDKLFPQEDDDFDPIGPAKPPSGPTPMNYRSPNTPPTNTPPTNTPPTNTPPTNTPPTNTPPTNTPPTNTPPTNTPPTTYLGPAAILDHDAIHTPDGKYHSWPEITHLGQIAELVPALNIGHDKNSLRETGQIWITKEAALKLNIAVDKLGEIPHEILPNLKSITTSHPLITNALKAGYRLGGKTDTNYLVGWNRVFRGNDKKPLAVIVIMSALYEHALLEDSPLPKQLLERIKLVTDSIGMPPFMNPGQNGIDLAVKTRFKHPDRNRLFKAVDPVPPALISNTEQDHNWTRKPSKEESKQLYIHAYDRSGSYAAGMASLELGIGSPTHHTNGTNFNPKLPGYWKIHVPESSNLYLPHPLAPGGLSTPNQPIWVTTPTLELATEMDYEPEILEAYTWEEHTRVLQPFYEKIRDGRSNLIHKIESLSRPQDEAEFIDLENAEHALSYVKNVYTRTIGMMGSNEYMKGRQGYAPDRRHHIIAKSRANILRLVNKIGTNTGNWPVAIFTDTICYLSNNPDPISAWPGDKNKLGKGFGSFKPEGSALLKDHLKYLNGNKWEGKHSLINPVEWNQQ